MRKIKIVIAILLISETLFSQANQSHEEYMKRVLNSCQASSSFVFSDYSKEGNVDVSTGRFGINIPFTMLENQYLSLPISLTYSTSGVKVDESSSEVGMGWNLIAGGQITRKLNGNADDVTIGTWDANLFVERRPPTGGESTLVEDWKSQFSQYSNKSKTNGSVKIVSDDIVEYGMGQLQAYNEFYSKYYPLPRKTHHTASPLISDNPMWSIFDMINNSAGVETQRDVFQVSVGDLNFSFILKLKDDVLSQVDLTHRGRLPYGVGAFNTETYYEAVPLNDNDIKIDIIRGEDNYFYKWVGESNRTRQNNLITSFFKGFIITDKKGVKYYFENYLFTEPEHIRVLSNHSDTSPNGQRIIQGLMQDVQINNWVLSKIILPNNETIEYEYLKKRITEEKIIPREHDGEYTNHPYNLRPPKTPYGYDNINFDYEKLYVTKINSRNKTIKFNYEGLRADLQNGQILKNIQLFDFKNSLVKQFDLISTYKVNGSFINYLTTRLFLDKIIEKSITDRNNIQYDIKNKEYIFDYYNPNVLPSKNAIGFEDLYGYFLGNSVENAYPPFPKLYINSLSTAEGNRISYYPITAAKNITFNGVDRIPNSSTVHFGAMKEIKFPTSGSLVIEYEPNQFYSTPTVEKNLNGPGCRVKDLKYFNNQNTLVKNKRYKYLLFDNQAASSGVLMYKPSFAYIANYVIDNSLDLSAEENKVYSGCCSNDLFNMMYKYTTTKEVLNQKGITDLPSLYRKLITTSTHPIGPQSDYFGRDMIYTNVLEEDISIVDASTSKGKIKYYNYYSDNRPEVNVMSGPTDEVTYIPPCSNNIYSRGGAMAPIGSEAGVGGSSGVKPWNYYSGEQFYNGIKVKYGLVEKKGKEIFPFPERNFFNNNDALKIGKTYKIEYYNNLNVKVQENKYTYSLINNASYKTLNFKIDYKDTYYYRSRTDRDNSNNRDRFGDIFKSGLYFYSIDNLYTKQKLVLENVDIIKYENNGIISNSTKNYFNNSFLINKISKTNSNQIIQEDFFHYPSDYTQGEDIINLKQKNRISEIIKSESTVNNEIVSSSINKYTEFPLSNQNSFSVINHVYSKKGDLNVNSLLEDELFVSYEKYDEIGNLLQFKKANGISTSIIWGYNKTFPIAKIENIQYSQLQPGILSALQNASNSNSEIELINQQNNLRSILSDLSNINITTYTYKPLIGVSTITDPKGDKITYSYDSFGRLESVTDKDGNVLSENKYNYRPN